jgi:hypothetical protein
MELPADPGLTLTAHTAEPGTPAEQALRFLASWTEAPEQRPGDRRHASGERTS